MTDTLKYGLARMISGQASVMEWDSFPVEARESLLALSRGEGVGPLLYWRLRNSGYFSSLPEQMRDSLRAAYAGTWMQNKHLFDELDGISSSFQAAGIPLVLLKGACYALTIYPDIGLRPMGDLDILVPPADIATAARLAGSLGYADSHPEAAPGLRDLLNHEICLQKPGQAAALEIHHSLVADKTYTYAVPVEWFWQQTRPLAANPAGVRLGGALLMLSPTAQVLYAAAHAMLQHGGQAAPLRWFYDIDQLIRFYESQLDWALLLAQAQEFEWGSALAAALGQTRAYFETPLPEFAWRALSGQIDRHHELVALKQNRPATHTLLEYQKLRSLNWRGRFWLVLALLAPRPAYMRRRYGFRSSLALPFYYLARWAGIARDAVLTLLELARRGLRAGEKKDDNRP